MPHSCLLKLEKEGTLRDQLHITATDHAVQRITRLFKSPELGGLVTAYEEVVLRWHGFWRDGGETSHIRKASTTREARNTWKCHPVPRIHSKQGSTISVIFLPTRMTQGSWVTQLHKLTLASYRTTRKGETRMSVTCGSSEWLLPHRLRQGTYLQKKKLQETKWFS